MKLAFIGTHGVGKTTLCYDLAAVLKRQGINVDMVKEVARLSPLPINRKTSLEAQTWILATQMAEEIRSGSQHDVVICDRSVLDNYAYLVHRLGPQPPLDAVISHWMRTYTHLFKVPIVAPPAFDGVRDTTREFQEAIDREVEGLIARFQVPVHRLDADDRPHWIERVAEWVGAPPTPPQMGLFVEGGS
jgi:predicted ATPase